MRLSDEGLRLITSFEGYHKKQEDGSCKAYRCPAGVWTCGWGCTEDVDAHTHWTKAEAEQRFRKELDKFEVAVMKHVKVPLNQNEFDALVSFAYNLGEGALMKSSILQLLNKEKRTDAAKAFNLFVKAVDPKTRKLRALPGLVSRRARESALFLKPVQMPEEPHMPQSVVAEKTVARKLTEAVAATTATATVVNQAAPAVAPSLPSIPTPPKEAIEAVTQWQSVGESVMQFAHSPGFWVAVCGILLAVFAPMVARRFA